MWIIQRLARVDDHAVEWQDTLWHTHPVFEPGGKIIEETYNPRKIASAARFVQIDLRKMYPGEHYRISWRDDEQDQ